MTPRRTGRRAVAALLAAVALSACSGDDDATGDPSAATTTFTVADTVRPTTAATTVASSVPSSSAAPSTPAAPTSSAVASTTVPTSTAPAAPPPPSAGLAAIPLAWHNVNKLPKLTAMAARPDGLIIMTSETGEVWKVDAAGGSEMVLDLTAAVSPWEPGSERGLLGAAFDPAGTRLYLYYTDVAIDSHLVSYAVGADGHIDPASEREVLFVDQPGLGHKGGGIAVTPDGTLFLALGDGGASDGLDAQDDTELLGKVIRITPKPDGPGYDVPPDNPFVGQPGIAPEIWAKGLRNPWGFAIDAATGDLWTGDVGNHTMEEIDRIPNGTNGQNFGWYWIEGTFVRVHGAPAEVVAPVFAYRHDEVGPAAIGGRVYRGAAIAGLAGAYVFGDITGALFAIGAGDETVRLPARVPGVLTGFGLGPDDELWALTLDKGAFLLTTG